MCLGYAMRLFFFFFFSTWAPLHTQEGDTLSLNSPCLGFRLGLSPSHWTPSPYRRLGRNPRGGTLVAQVAKGPRGNMPASALLHTGGTGKGSQDQPLTPRFFYPYQHEAKGPGPEFSSPIFPNSQGAKCSREQRTYS